MTGTATALNATRRNDSVMRSVRMSRALLDRLADAKEARGDHSMSETIRRILIAALLAEDGK